MESHSVLVASVQLFLKKLQMKCKSVTEWVVRINADKNANYLLPILLFLCNVYFYFNLVISGSVLTNRNSRFGSEILRFVDNLCLFKSNHRVLYHLVI